MQSNAQQPLSSQTDMTETAHPEQNADCDSNAQEKCVSGQKEQQSESPVSLGLLYKLAPFAPILLLLLVGCQAWPDFWQAYTGTALYCPAEIQHIEIAQETANGVHWYAPMTSHPAQWPGFTWLLIAISFLPTSLHWLVYPLAGAATAFLAVFGVWCFARAVGFGGAAAFASTLILLCAPLFAPLVHFIGPSALASAFMLFSLAMFCRGWQADSAWLAHTGAFLCAGLAGLCGGLFFLAIPLITSIFFLIWRCTFSRGHALDATFGFLVLLLLLGGWFGSVVLFTHAEKYIQELFGEWGQLFTSIPSHWWRIPTIAALGFCPWLLIPLCASWGKTIKNAWPSLKASRKEQAGSSFAWFSFVTALGLAVFLPAHHSMAVALVCLAAPLAGKSLLALSPLGKRVFVGVSMLAYILVSLLLVATYFGSLADILLPLLPDKQQFSLVLSLVSQVPWFAPLGLFCLLAVLPMVRFFRRSATTGGFLLYCTLVCTLLHQPAVLLIAPALGSISEARLFKLEAQHAPAVIPDVQHSLVPETDPTPSVENPTHGGESQGEPHQPTNSPMHPKQDANPVDNI